MSDLLDKINSELDKSKVPVAIKEKPKRGRPKGSTKKGVSKKWIELSPEEQARRIALCSTAAERGLLVRDVRRQLEADGLAKTPDTLKLARKIVADSEKRHMEKLIPDEMTKAEKAKLKVDAKEKLKAMEEDEDPWDISMPPTPKPKTLKPEPVQPKPEPKPEPQPEPQPDQPPSFQAPTTGRRKMNLFTKSGYNASLF